ncbi:hypothetical protein ACFOWM_03050 [Ferruginibacter yonginensis]|uniref:DUF4270 family protein n=1 Tax=Ferruginibacter yonginensis TaxID=1310416 RepID=A0ABV8QS35_9BACT
MKNILKYAFVVAAVAAVTTSCKKFDTNINGAANTTTSAASYLTLNNRVQAAFVIDSSTLPYLPAGLLPSSYNKFRKLLTYDTVATVNKPTIYNVGDVINIVGYLKGDDSAIAKRRINFRFFQPPSSFITPTALFPMQRAEESYRGFAPATADILNTVSTTNIAPTNVAPFNVSIVNNESIAGINYNTYLVRLTYTIPASLSGKLISINLTANTAGAAADIGNVNWIYAFRVR